MKIAFDYSKITSDKVIDYLIKENFLSPKETQELARKAEDQKVSSYRVFIRENPGFTEKSAQLVAYLTEKPYFEYQERIPVCTHKAFNAESSLNNGAYLIRDADGNKLLCLDPDHEEFKKTVKDAGMDSLPKLVMSHITFHKIKENFNNLVRSATQAGAQAKSKVSIIDSDQHESANANKFVFDMLKGCVEKGASDVHVDLDLNERGQAGFKLRYRIDGACQDESFSDDIMLYRGIVNKLKLDAGLKIDERRLPQDGRVSFEIDGKVHNFRLSFMPNTIRNAQEEKIVLRLMADVTKCDLYGLNILPYDLEFLEKAIRYPHGFVCVTGPTGSGKTTLLYALLQQINRTTKNVLTLEDPIEAEIPLVNQSQMFHRIGYDFAMGLRVILRQDPDIIMVGEMRDEETAHKAFEAANTGHLVFSTLHTNTAASSITRLLQMNVPHYFISSSLKFVVAQRLIRRLNPKLSRPHPDAEIILKEISRAFDDASAPVKALLTEAMNNPMVLDVVKNGESGYKGRMAIMEVMQINDEIRRIINFEQGNEYKIEQAATKNGMLTIQQYGYIQVLKGLTTFEEVNNAVLSN